MVGALAETDSGKVRSLIVVLAWKVLTGLNDRARSPWHWEWRW